MDLNPLNQTALHVLINWAQQDLRWDDAIVRVQTYLKKIRDDADMTYALAGLYFQKGSLNEAEEAIDKLAALEASRPEVNELKELIHQKRS